MNFEEHFDASYERIIADAASRRNFFYAFYGHFLASSEIVAEKFVRTDMEKQYSMLEKSFYSLLTFYASGNTDYLLKKIATSHNQFNLNIEPKLYDLWLESLVVTAREFDPEFNAEVELGWRLVMSPGITYMKFAYNCKQLP